eukprot:GFUD01012052.1.p1 GENE.GFUD01012052.1~~GFUD01012052.1.p1  ORF type:complete len:386 (-),score=63.12 GFUD01012052.1:152-1309(-)
MARLSLIVFSLLILLPLIHTTAANSTLLSYCDAALACTTSGTGSQAHCLPDSIKENKTIFITNIIFIIIIGTIGNLLTLFALPYAKICYSQRFTSLSSSTTILLLHLALCDLLYCLLGLTVHASIYTNGHLNTTESFCFWNGWVRNLIAYTDFFTMALIAFTRCIGIVFDQTCHNGITKFFSPKVTMISCLLLWLLAFIILSPTTFGVEGFGTFGYDQTHGKCEIKQCKEQESGFNISPSGWYFLGASTVPCLIIITSYIMISLFITAHSRIMAKVHPGMKSSVDATHINVTLLALSISYCLFTLPVLPIEFGLLDTYFPENTAFYSLCIMSWYWWIYASNFLIYVVTTQDFRTIYRLFLGDLAFKLCANNFADKNIASIKNMSN